MTVGELKKELLQWDNEDRIVIEVPNRIGVFKELRSIELGLETWGLPQDYFEHHKQRFNTLVLIGSE